MGIAHRSAVVGTPEAIPVISDLPSEISRVGAPENISENPSGTGATDGKGRITESGGMLH